MAAREIDFGSMDVASGVREEFEDFIADVDDRRQHTVAVRDDAGDVLGDMAMQAADSLADMETGYNPADVELTRTERQRLDFGETSYVEAKAAKAAAHNAGVDDFISYYDPELTVGENQSVFERAAREERGRRSDERRSDTQRLAGAYRAEQQGIEQHAIKGAKMGHQEAISELRSMGWSPAEIDEIVATDQVQAALTPGATVHLSNGMTTTPRQWSRAKRSHEHRRVRSQYADEARQAPVTTDYEQWREHPDKYDYPGVDTRKPVGEYLADEDRKEFTSLTRRLWTWQPGTGRGL
jgi:hypothetical protein